MPVGIDRRVCGWLVAVAALAISPIAHADPVNIACSGAKLLPNGTITNTILSPTVDLRAGTVTVGDNQPAGILPAPAPPESGLDQSKIIERRNELSFTGPKEDNLFGRIDRVTGEANIFFQPKTPEEQFFHGTCKPALKLF